ncbi:hypothetical protein [Gluconobacter frateurii]|uniref:hypothetical protein n=1 Tax=Gluconobacter frateurii TaxID=38308 RepID=UPI0011AF9AE7|nr:hypothetical protein [Gluconobacter frateurii]
MNRVFSDNQYPDMLIAGGSLAVAFGTIRKRLEELFDPAVYEHAVIPPRATLADWKELTRRMPMVGLGFMGCPPAQRVGANFRGDAQFYLVLLTRQQPGLEAYFGDGTLPGILGLSAVAALGLHGMKVKGLGTCEVRQLTTTGEQEWLEDNVASVQLQVTIPGLSFDTPEYLAQLDTLKTLSQTYVDSTGETP